MNFLIITSDNNSFYVSADDHSAAATKVAKKLHGGGVFGVRCSGEPAGSGMFKAFYNIKSEAMMNCVGSPFHVMEV